MSNIINKCEFCHDIFNENYVDSKCPNCGTPLNYKNSEYTLEELSYPYKALNHPSDFIYPSFNVKKIHKPYIAFNKNRYNDKHFFHIIPIYKYIGKTILSVLACAWDFDFNNAYSVYDNSDGLFNYYLNNFSLENFNIAHNKEECYFDVYTILVDKDTYNKFNSLLVDVTNNISSLSTFYQLYTSINWNYLEERQAQKTFYEYAAVNYILHIMEVCRIASLFNDIDEKLISFDKIEQHPNVITTIKGMSIAKYLSKEKNKEYEISKLKEDFNFLQENEIYDFNDVYDFYSSLEEGAIAPNAVPLSVAAVRSANVYNKLYTLGYKPNLSIYSVDNKTSLCPSFEDEYNIIHYIECNNNIMNGINEFDSYEEMNSILDEVYNDNNEKSIFITIHNVPSEVISNILQRSENNTSLLKSIYNLNNKYGDKPEHNYEDIYEKTLENKTNTIADNFKRVEITDSSLFKYKHTHFRLRNIEWAGNKHGYLFIDKNEFVTGFIISEDKPNDGIIYRDYPFEIINEITHVEVSSEYKNKNMEIGMIEMMIRNFNCKALSTKSIELSNILTKLNYKKLNTIRNTKYFWLSIVSPISEEKQITLNEAFNTTKRRKIEETVIGVFDLLDKTKLNSQKYKEFFRSMNDKAFDEWMKEFLRSPKRNFYLEVLPNKNSPTIRDAANALEYLKVPVEEYVYYRHDGHKNDPIRTRYRVPVLYVSMRRLQQMLTKKNTYSIDIDKRNMKTGQVSGDNKIARISDVENYCLLTYNTDCYALKEFLGPRADSMDAKYQMYKDISKQGYFYMKDLPNDISKKQSLNTVNTLLLGAGIDNDTLLHDDVIKAFTKEK